MCEELLLVENAVWVVTAPTGIAIYDFDFNTFLPCRHPWQRPERITAVARIGAFEEYDQRYQELHAKGISLVHSPAQHLRASELPNWYPVLEDLTPRSLCFDHVPTADEVSSILRWPIFVKGQRQTSRHQRALSIINGPEQFKKAMETYQQDAILQWQGVVCREFIPLRPVEDPNPERIPSSFEFRSFWWKSELVGLGRYWWEGKPYQMSEAERRNAVSIAAEAARRVNVPFLVVDIAQTMDGSWIVIECNDAQESGYAGVAPLSLWQSIIDAEKRQSRS
jgi:hypothetical protein